MYRAYLRTFDQHVSDKTITHSQQAAADAFTELVSRTDLDGQKLAAVLSFKNRQLAFHRFDRQPGEPDYWRDKLDEIEWPEIGRPASLDGGKRVNVYLDASTYTIASIAGDGNISGGLRIMADFFRDNRQKLK